jgi:hypothetical protein
MARHEARKALITGTACAAGAVLERLCAWTACGPAPATAPALAYPEYWRVWTAAVWEQDQACASRGAPVVCQTAATGSTS